MPVAHQIPDQSCILRDPPCALTVGDPRRLHDRSIVTHVVDDADEAVIQDRDRAIEDFLERLDGGSASDMVLSALSLDLGKLLRGERQGGSIHNERSGVRTDNKFAGQPLARRRGGPLGPGRLLRYPGVAPDSPAIGES